MPASARERAGKTTAAALILPRVIYHVADRNTLIAGLLTDHALGLGTRGTSSRGPQRFTDGSAAAMHGNRTLLPSPTVIATNFAADSVRVAKSDSLSPWAWGEFLQEPVENGCVIQR